MAGKPAKRGNRRPVEFVADPDTGNPVDGLRYHKTTKRYYRIEKGNRVYYPKQDLTGVNYLRRAIFLHQCWQTGKEPDSAAFIPVQQTAYDDFGREIPVTATFDDNGVEVNGVYIPLDAVYNWVYDQLMNSETRKEFAERVKIPELVYLEKLRPKELSLTLDEIGELYFNKPDAISWQAMRDAKMYWREFQDIVNVKRVSDIVADHIRNYRDDVHERRKRENRKPSWVKRRYGQVKTILRNALTEGRDSEELQRVLTLCDMLKPPKNGKKTKPQPISVEHFHALLNVTKNPRDKAMWLCMLNFCMKPTEIVVLAKTDIDLDLQTLVSERQKTGETRIASVWQQTKDAIKEYQSACSHEAETLFATEDGETFSEIRGGRTISQAFRKYRKEAGIPDSVMTEHIRDGAYSAAIANGADLLHAKMLAGHSVGISDDYVRRNPMMVKDACDAIERHYFGD